MSPGDGIKSPGTIEGVQRLLCPDHPKKEEEIAHEGQT